MNKQSLALSIIRIAAAANLLIHGTSRLITGGASGFDGYLGNLGFPPFTAWVITFFEIIAASCIIANRWVAPLCVVFIAELATGIFLVHRHEGWFVVGGGRNGMEYSVLLIVCFAATAIANWKKN